MAIKHAFVSAVPDGGNTSLVNPSDWNEDHDIDTSTVTPATGDKLLLKDVSDGEAVADCLVSALRDLIIAAIVDSAPGTLDTLNELAAALGDDPNFATTIAASIAAKVDNTPYDATSWNGVTTVAPSKDAVRDKFESLSSGGSAGKQTIYIPAAAMSPATTDGAAVAQVESASNKINYPVLDFDGATSEYAHFSVAFPKSWDEGTVSFKAFWETTHTGTNGVAWLLQGVAVSDGDTADAAYGSFATAVDNGQSSAAKRYITAESSAITIAGSPAEGDIVHLRLGRDTTDGSDTMAEDARLVGVQVFYTTNANNDA